MYIKVGCKRANMHCIHHKQMLKMNVDIMQNTNRKQTEIKWFRPLFSDHKTIVTYLFFSLYIIYPVSVICFVNGNMELNLLFPCTRYLVYDHDSLLPYALHLSQTETFVNIGIYLLISLH